MLDQCLATRGNFAFDLAKGKGPSHGGYFVGVQLEVGLQLYFRAILELQPTYKVDRN